MAEGVDRVVFYLIILTTISLLYVSLFKLWERENSPITGYVASVCSAGNACDGKTPGQKFPCNSNSEFDPKGEITCTCDTKCNVSASTTCVAGNSCDGRTPGSIFRCNEKKTYDKRGSLYCACNSLCKPDLTTP